MVIADTDILVASFRKNEIAKQLIRKYGAHLYVSVVTEMELYSGARSVGKKRSVEDVLMTHEAIPLSKAIGATALGLMKRYNTHTGSLFLADALIAATCLECHARLLTFNTRDFKFIKGLKLAK